MLIISKNLQNQKNWSEEEKNPLILKNAFILLNGRKKVVNIFESGIFPKEKQGKIFTSIFDLAARVVLNILYHTFNTILSISLKKTWDSKDNPLIRIYM